jgi:Protein of unknown function (DUF1615)
MRTLFLALVLATLLPVQANAGVSVQGVANLIRLAERGVADPQGWASDMLDVLRQNGFDQGKENICASIAVIDQESNFNANPAVPGLGKLSEAALREKLGGYPIVGSMAARFLEDTPSTDDSYMLRIRRAHTERDLDLVYRSLVSDAANRAGLEEIVGLGLFNRAIDARNEISTAGSMQVSVRFALDEANHRRFLPMSLSDTYAVRDELYSRRGGMDYGILRLLGYETGYDRKIYRFADYNAGRYSSRNAAFQNVIATLSGQQLAPDGDLLLYKDGKARSKASASEKALRKILANMKPDQIRKELLTEKSIDFISTQTFVKTRELYRAKFRRDPPFAAIPDISLHSIKISHPMKTANFAESVNRRYQACMATPE